MRKRTGLTVRRVGGTPAQPQRAAKQRKAFEEGGLRHVALKRAESRKAFEEAICGMSL